MTAVDRAGGRAELAEHLLHVGIDRAEDAVDAGMIARSVAALVAPQGEPAPQPDKMPRVVRAEIIVVTLAQQAAGASAQRKADIAAPEPTRSPLDAKLSTAV